MSEDSLEKVIREIVEWQKVQFPQATQKSRATHLLREAAELYVEPNDAIEAVDIIFLAVGIVEEAGEDLLKVLRYKLDKNKERQWGKIDSDGVVEHIEDENPISYVDPEEKRYEQHEWSGPTAAHIRMMLDGELPA